MTKETHQEEPASEVLDPARVEKQIQTFKPNPAFATALVPKGFEEAMKIAEVLATSGVVPQGLVNKPQACFVAISFGMEVGLPPMQAVQNIMVVNGRPSIWGDAALALVFGSGVVKDVEEDAPDVALEQGYGRCRVALSNGRVVERRFSIDEAKKAKLWTKTGPWQDYPGRMLQMRARSWALRDACPHVLKGMTIREEAQDIAVDARTGAEVRMPKSLKDRAVDASEAGGGGEDAGRGENVAPAPNQAPPREGLEQPAKQESDAQEPGDAPGDPEPPKDAPNDKFQITQARRKQLFELWTAKKIPLAVVTDYVRRTFKIDATKDLTNAQAKKLEAWINAYKP
jgi:hypothetical protein